FANDGRGGALAGCVETVGARAKELKVLATSDPIPNDVIAARPGAPTEMVSSLRTALLSLSRTAPGREKLGSVFHADGFVPADDADYNSLRSARRCTGACFATCCCRTFGCGLSTY